MIRRWLPHPLLSALLALLWLIFNQSVAPGTVLLGVVFGLVLGRMFDLLDPPQARLRHYPLLLRLFVRVVLDIVRSNIAVARIVLFNTRPVHSGFVAIPLELTDRYGLPYSRASSPPRPARSGSATTPTPTSC
ncbi:Na+/H+ antiporter subunit E OS=Rhodanobacter lindaniclasticus OX=75310 GN=B1991_06525 PE=3 SV=1 [Rhodanobacter lindaniclasticus]